MSAHPSADTLAPILAAAQMAANAASGDSNDNEIDLLRGAFDMAFMTLRDASLIDEDLVSAANDVDAAAAGDSNDDEIETLQSALDLALNRLGLALPEPETT